MPAVDTTPTETNPTRPPSGTIALDIFVAMLLSVACYSAAYLLRFADGISLANAEAYKHSLVVIAAVRLVTLLLTGRQQVWSRYFSLHDLVRLARSVGIGTIAISFVDALLLTEVTIPRSILLLDCGIHFIAAASVAAAPRIYHETVRHRRNRHETHERTLIIGANDEGESLLRVITRTPSLRIKPVGFVDMHPAALGRRIGGVPVLGGLDDIVGVVRKHRVKQVLTYSGCLPGKSIRKLVEIANDNNFSVRVLPSHEQLLNEDVQVQPRQVAIADLLRRTPVNFRHGEVGEWIEGRTVLVTGSAGSIGSEISRQLLALKPKKLVLLDRSETGQYFLDREMRRLETNVLCEVVVGDLTDKDRLNTVLGQHAPDIVFHAAAYKHVPLMEANPGEAVKNIVDATRNIVDAAEAHKVSAFVMISTDKAVNPTSVMGSCKRLAEQYVQSKASTSDCRLVTVRFGNVLDSAGSVVPLFRQQIAAGGPVTVTHPDMVRYFMLIPEAAQLVIQAGALGQGGEIFVLDMGEPVRMMDLANDMIRLSGLKPGQDIEIKICGLRPGEKLYEELYSDEEPLQPTRCEKILIASGASPPLLSVLAKVNRLVASANEEDSTVLELLHEIVPQCPAEAAKSRPSVRLAS